MKRKIALVLVAVLAISAVTTGLAIAGTRARTTVTIQGPNGDFEGTVRSRDPGCRGDRIVRLFMATSANGPFERTGNMDTTEVQGNVGVWSMGNTGHRDGFFQARAKRTESCRAGRSPILELDNGVPQ